MKTFLFLLLFFSFNPAYAGFIEDANKVIKSLDSNFITYNKYKNHFHSLKQGRAEALIIVTGVAEPVIKYWQLVDEFKDDYDIYLWDHINQGLSMKIRSDINYKKVFIDNFSTYERTLDNFINKVKPRYRGVNVISHSMGSHIMLRQLLKKTKSVDKLVLVTPMIDVKKFFIPDWLAKFILKTFYKPHDWAPSQGDEKADASYLTSSRENFENYIQLLNKFYPKQKSTGVTAGWLLKSLDSINYVLDSDFSNVSTPVLMFTAGDDAVIKSKKASSFCSTLSQCKNIHYENGKHQLLIEVDDIRFDLYKQMKVFFKQTSNK